jgi:hypothetical protein
MIGIKFEEIPMAGPKNFSMSSNTAANDITGDRIQTKGTLSEQGRRNFDNIDWGKSARDAAVLLKAAAMSSDV